MARRSLVAVAVAVALLPLVSALATPAAAADGAPRGAASARPTAQRLPGRPDALTRALRDGRIDRATYALERARTLFDLGGVRERFGEVARPGPRDATMLLRDLVLAYERLDPAQRAVADAIVARPTDGAQDPFGHGYTVEEETPFCVPHGCIHYVATTRDRPPMKDVGGVAGVPDWVETVASEFRNVWDTEITGFGFRAPKPDGASANDGGNDRIDIYLADVGVDGLYGYCSTDDPNAFRRSYRYYDFSAYCVVDDDFSPRQFPGVSGLDALRVTLAHEFFHASQFAYDAAEDRWFMESTAAWMEDEVYDDVDDNVQYLRSGALGRPRMPLDANNDAFGVYGNWIFPRFLSEYLGTPGVHDTSLILDAWERADASPTGDDRYSLQAIAGALNAEGHRFRELFAEFGMRNDVPRFFYEEGAANAYPRPRRTVSYGVTRRNGGAAGSTVTKHLTNTYVSFEPGTGVAGDARLRVKVDLPPSAAGSEASIVVRPEGADPTTFRLDLNDEGNGAKRVAFGRGTILAVDLVLTNASMRRATPCWRDPDWAYSCAAFPEDDGLTYAFSAKLVQ